MSAGGHDRRAFFRQLLRGATRAAEEMESLRRATDDAVRRATSLGEETEPAWHPVAASPTTRVATTGELRTLCAQVGRAEWGDEAVSLARTGFRLTRGGDGRSWLGGTPRAGSFEWPLWDGAELAFLGRIALDGLPPCGLPGSGALLVFFAVDRAPSGDRPAETGACRVLHVDDAPLSDEPLYAGMPFVPVSLSAELTLPAAPASIAVDIDELEAWTELRERLAAAQGVELEETAASYHALHRLLGHPDTYAEGMEVDAERVSRGIDLDEEPFSDAAEEVSTATADWTLLLQLSNDDDLALDLGDAARLFVWVRRDDLAAGRFEGVQAFVR